MARINTGFHFSKFSNKQKKVLTWWLEESGVSDCEGIIADGAIRSGKTVCMSLSFVQWSMSTFNGENFGMCGKTVGSFRRNVLSVLKKMLPGRGYKIQDKRSENVVIISRGNVENYYYIFGGKDESSQDLIQGITLAGILLDEVVLMPRSFVEQAVGRCSVEGSKLWFNCNPENPTHWFKKEWIDRVAERNIVYLHFTQDDNLSLSEKIKARYRAMFSGVFFDRFVRGLWVRAEGAIYHLFADDPKKYAISKKDLPKTHNYITVGVDFGGNKSAFAFVATMITKDWWIIPLRSVRIPAKGISVEQMMKKFVAFCKGISESYGYEIDYVYADSAEQAIINSMYQNTEYNIRNSVKGEIIDRIRTMDVLISTMRFRYVEGECDSLVAALTDAVWDDKKLDDVRLDDGTSDIDTLDAFEYSWSWAIKQILRG